jgi:hypothetical protein
MTKQEFIARYNPVLNKAGNIKRVAHKAASYFPPERVWSVVSGDYGHGSYLLPGFRIVNATGRYVVTAHPWTESDNFEVKL